MGNLESFIKNVLNQHDKYLQHWRNIHHQDSENYHECLGDNN